MKTLRSAYYTRQTVIPEFRKSRIINYYFGKSNLSPIKPHYAEAVTFSGHKTLYVCYAYYFSKNEKDNILQDYATHESYFYGLEKYLKEEGFYVKDSTNNDSITISW